MALTWTKEPTKDGLAQDLRRGIRRFRREKGRSGHRFRYDDLRILWSAGKNKEHAVMTHCEDKLWQYWRKGDDGWKLISWHKKLADAQAEAEKPMPKTPVNVEPPQPKPGIYVHARWIKDPYRGERPIVVRCSTDYTLAAVTDAFTRLGCTIEVKEVA